MSQSERDVIEQSGAASGAGFDVHGVVGIEVAPGTPGESQLRDMLAPFLGKSSAARRLHISEGISPVSGQSHAEDAYRFTAESLYLPGDRVQIIETPDGYRIEGSGELLTAVIPLLDRLCVQEETAMIHAAVVDFRGAGVLLPAWGGVGKTSTVAKLVAMRDVRFMADDWAFLGAGGMLLGYAKPMFIKPHHRAIYPALFHGTRKPLAPGWLTTPVAHLATAVHPVIVRYPKTAAFTRRWSPEHRMVHPEQVFGAERISSAAPAQLAIFLERFDGAEALLEPRSTEWMTSRIIGNFHSELPTVSRRLIEALGASGLVPLEEHFGEKAAVVRRALDGVPCSLLRLPVTWSADRTSDFVANVVRSKLDG
ncbi:hypothetical protein [Pseudarthrobacter sp. PvP090]|uniref:hypothetical protein n=1 Tax=Pseudarthrobacter sp. PvP090 TaxID=3156393 RepID=UPI003394EAC0